MSKKLLSVLLAILMVVGSVSCLFTMSTVTASAEEENLMANIQASDWTSGWNSSSGVERDGAISVSAAWRSVYTKVTLAPETEYNLTFKFGQTRVGDVRVYPASEITDPSTQLISVGSAPTAGGTTNLASEAITCSITSGTPVDGEFYEASESFTTTTETEYYIILDCYQCADSKNCVLLKDMSITEVPYDPNVLNDEVMAGLTWNAIWSGGLRNAKTDLDKSESYSGSSYAMSWDRNSRYRDNYTVVTLEPYTNYEFSFRYKASGTEEIVQNIGFIDASKVDFTTYLGDKVKAHITDTFATIMGADNATLEQSTNGAWNLVSTTFTTGSATEYVMIIGVGTYIDNSFTTITLSDFSLIGEAYDITDELVNPVNWNSTWRLQGATVNVTAATESKNGGAGVYVDKSNYRDSFVTVVLDANSEYTLSFNYKGTSVLQKVWVYDKADIDLAGYYETNAKYPDSISGAVKSGASPLGEIYTANAGTFDGETWLNVTIKFNTTENREYYIVLNHGANSGFTASDLTLEKKVVNPDNVLGNSVAADWGSSWAGKTATTNAAGYISVTSAYRSAYTKVTLEPNTKYTFNVNHGEVRVTDIRVFAASEITDTTTQLVSADGGGAAPGGTNNLATASVVTDCPATPVAGEFYTSSETFTTGSETEYYILLDCGAFSTTSIVLKDLDLSPYVYDANTDVVDPSNWESTWNLSNPGAVAFTNTTDSCEGGIAINGSKSNYRSSFVLLTLDANTTYDLTFNYKGASELAALQIIAESDIDATKYANKPEHLIQAIKDGASSVYATSLSGMTYDNATWNNISISFTTNDNTKYYLAFQHGAGSGFTASDFNFVVKEAALEIDDLTDTVATDWTSSWSGLTGTYEKVIAVKNAWHSAYTKVTLEPYTNYTFDFMASTVKVNDVRVYAASEITDATTQLVSSSWITGGTNDLVTYFSTTAPADSYETATTDLVNEYYDVSVEFATAADTEYYIIVDGGQFLNNGDVNQYCTFTHIKNLSLIAGEKVYIDPNVLNDAAMSKLTWKALWKDNEGNNADQTITSTVLDKAESYSGDAYAMSWGRQTRYRDNYTVLNLEPNTKYQLSFRYKAAGVEEYIHYIGFVASNKVDLTLTAENIEGRLLDSSTEILGKANATVEKNLNGTWNLVSTTFTTGEETEYVFHMGIGSYVDNTFSTITFSDFSLLEYEDPNKLVDATVANGDVRFSVGADSEDYYITGEEGKEDELVTYTDSAGEEVTRSRVYYYDEQNAAYNYNGGYAWRIIISSEEAMNVYNPAVYGYITAKGLAANTKYTFSYIYTDTYHIKLADIYNADGSLAFDATTKILPNKDGATSHSYMVTATFTTDAEGDYNFKIQTGRSDKYYIYDGSSWAMTLSDLSLVEYEEDTSVDTPDDANVLEDLSAFDWEYTWAKEGEAYSLTVDNNTLNFNGIHYHGVYTMLELAPNTEYTLTFDYVSRASIDKVGIVATENVNLANVGSTLSSGIVNVRGGLTYYQNIEKVDDGTSKNATVKFVTGDSTSYYLYIEGTSGPVSGLSGNTVISNMSLTKATETLEAKKVYYDFEDSNIGVISTTSTSDIPSVVEENGNKYLQFTRTNDGITVPFYYRADQKYVISFDMKVLAYPTEQTLAMRFKTSAEDNNPLYYAGNVFSYRNDAYNIVTKDQNGKMLTSDVGLNYTENSQLNGVKHMFDSSLGTDWRHYEITIDPKYTYYTGLANFGFDAAESGWSIALDNIKVAALGGEFENTAEEKFTPTKYAAIRQRTIDSKQGIRVKSSIDTSLLTAGTDGFKIVQYGTLAINTASLAGKELVYDMLNSNYNAKVGVAYSAADGKNEVFSEDNGVVTFTGVLTGLKDYSTEYSVRGYMIAESADGEQFVIYEEETKSLSVYDVVYAILNDGVENDDDTVAKQIVAANESKYNSWVEENATEDEEEIVGTKTVNLAVSNSASPIIDDYRGFSGTVYHAFGFMEDDATGRVYNANMLDTELDRLEDAGVHYVRTRYQSQWIFDDATGYDWNSDRFGYFCNYAKALQERDIEVILQVGWHFDFISQEGTYSIRENDYFAGEGDDLYGESAGVDFTGKSDDDTRIIKAANRYAYMMANTLKYAKAKGVNNIKYLSYFVEPSNSYSKDGLDSVRAGHDKEKYVLFCRTMRDTLEDTYGVTDVKHMGPNEAGYSKLTEYVVENDPGLFDILTAHNYPQEGDVQTNYDEYYETMTDNQNYNVLNGYMTDFNDYADFLATAKANSGNNDIEFWSDEFNIKDFENGEDARGTSSAYRGLATAMGGIIAQQSGIHNTILWMSFDQLWTDKTSGDASTVSEFMNGIHQCGNAPSLFLSDQPYAQYYPTSLFSKYNGHENGTVYQTNLSSIASEGVYVGAVKLEDGSWTVSVVNMNSTAVNINVAFDTAINQTLYRHTFVAEKADSYTDAVLPGVDKTFTNVGASFTDVLPAGSFAVYTGVR